MIYLVVLAVAVLVVYLGLLLLLWRFQERVVFQPPLVPGSSPADSSQHSFQTDDGVNLHAYLVGEYSPGTTVVLAFHGNADLARWLVPWASEVAHAANVCVVLAEYRGYDHRDGNPTYHTSALDARAALRYVRDDMGVSPADLVYFGHSLGSAIAAELAAIEPPRALVLQSPFTSANDMSRRYLPGAPAFLLTRISRVHFDTVARVRDLRRPVWVAHGARDVIIPVRMGRIVFGAARQKGELLVLSRAGHNDVALVGGADYMAWLARAIGDGRGAVAAPDVTPDAPTETRSAP